MAVTDSTTITSPSAGQGSSSWLSDMGNFVNSPTGALLGTAVAGGVGLYEAGQAQRQAKGLTGQITGAAAPAATTSAGMYSQLTGGPQLGGPLGASIAGQTAAATTLTQTAQQYASGTLTSAQQMQVNQYVAQQRAQVDAQFAHSGNLDSSARDSAYQQIDNNAAMMAQQLVAGNVNIATGALGAVSSTYNSLLSNALSGAQLGVSATTNAVQMQIQADQQISQYVQQLMSGIAQGLSGNPAVGSATPGQGVGGALGSVLKGFGGGGGGVAAQPAAGVADTAFQAGQSSADIQAQAATPQDFSSQISDMAASPDFLTASNLDPVSAGA